MMRVCDICHDKKPTCPQCGKQQMNHDHWEDMWRCGPCYQFFYPEQVGLKTDTSAGIFHVGDTRH